MTPDLSVMQRWRASASTPVIRFSFVTLALLSLALPHEAAAQERPRPAAELAVGWVGFADDGVVSEALVGGSVRWYVLPRISLGPEFVYIAGDNHRHVVLTGNLTWDVFGTVNGLRSRVTPFLVVGAGVFQTRETFSSRDFTSNEGAFTAGGGVRATVGDRMLVGVEARGGWEPHLRVSGFVGVRLGN